MPSIAIIPARGGSRRIPRKNAVDFLGKPIIEYPITSAIQAKCFDEIMVSTDDEEIASVAKSLGATVPFFRSALASNDTATTVDVLLEVLSDYDKLDKHFTHICCLYPTSVFVTADMIKQGYKMLQEKDVNGIATFVSCDQPIERAFREEDGYVSLRNPEHGLTRTQDLPSSYFDAGQMYFLKVATLLEERKIFVSKLRPIFIESNHVQDIDYQEDLALAKLKYKLLHGLSTYDK